MHKVGAQENARGVGVISACTTKLAVGCWAMGLRLGPSAACSRCHHGAPPTRSSACHCGGLGVGVGGSGWVLELV